MVNALILIDWRYVDLMLRNWSLLATSYIHTGTKKSNTKHALTLPLPTMAAEARPGMPGTGAAVSLPAWTRFTNGYTRKLFDGTRTTVAGSVIITIPANALTANVNLEVLIDNCFP
jgi:hypothetical protein